MASQTVESFAENGRRVPAEWEPQACVWLAWPHNRDTWPGRFDPIPGFYANWTRVVAESTPVRMLVDTTTVDSCLGAFGGAPPQNVDLFGIATNDCWVRDFGPTFVRDKDASLIGVDWRYNAWGGKYPPWDQDDEAGRKICQAANVAYERDELCLEGGALEVDGLGRMLTTGCLLTPSRNPNISKEQIARKMYHRLGITEIVWIENGGMEGDDTDGHIDQLARFIDPSNVVVASCDDASDPNHKRLADVARQLEIWASTTEPRVNIHRLPIPPKRMIDGQRVPESYCNFLRLGPDRMLVPTFHAATDNHALAMLRELSGADVTGLDCTDMIWGLGALHCASRDMP
ncbi:MAG: agmatine deiminase family protein [Planctomycetota bacterium]